MHTERPHRVLAARLRAAAADLPGERVAMATLAEAHGGAAQGMWLVLLAAPCLLPVAGVGTVLGLGLVALAVTMWHGQAASGLPGRVAELWLPQRWARRVLVLLAGFYERVGALARPRWSRLAGEPARGWLAAKVALMALLIVLPLPLGNLLPALALMLLGLALVFGDGLLVLCAALVAALAAAFSVAVVASVWSWGLSIL